MVDSTEAKSKSRQDIENAKDLGISRTIYAAGNSFKDALIWGTVAFLGAVALLAYGSKPGNKIEGLKKWLEEVHKLVRGKFTGAIAKVGELFGKKEIQGDSAVTPAVIASAAVAGSLVGHLVQIPSGIAGFNDAQKAVDKYAGVKSEREQLMQTNAALIEENQRYKAELEKKTGPSLPVTEADNTMLNSMGIAPEPVTQQASQSSSGREELKKPRPTAPLAANHTERALLKDEGVAQSVGA